MSGLDAASETHLQRWLEINLDAICDAEPSVLAKYVLALIGNEKNESVLRHNLNQELNEFLQDQCAPFVDRLLATLRSKSYLPYSDAVAPAPIRPYEGPRGKKRPLEQDDQEWARDRDSRPPPKGPRLNQDRPDRRMGPPQPRNDSYIPPLPRNRRNMNGGTPWPQQTAPGMFPPDMMLMNGPPPAANGGADSQPEGQAQRNDNQEPCYDYHNFGFCNRGDTCPYSHDTNAMPANLMQMQMAQMRAMMNAFGVQPNGWSNPMMMMGGPQGFPGPQNTRDLLPNGRPRAPVMHRSDEITNRSGELPVIQVLNPEPPREQRPHSRHDQGPRPPSPLQRHPDAMDVTPSWQDNGAAPNFGFTDGTDGHQPRQSQPPRPPRERGGGPGGSGRRVPLAPDSVTLVVEKIPQEHRNIRSLTDYFSKFGTVTHVAVDNRGDKALVSFSAHAEAQAAHASQDAVFGNRFVKVYWHRPQPGKGTIGEQALKDSAATVQALQNGAGNNAAVTGNGNLSRTFAGTSGSSASTSAPAPPEKKTPMQVFEEARTIWLAKVKGLMEELETKPAEEKKEIMLKLKVLRSQQPKPPTEPSTPALAASEDTVMASSQKAESTSMDLDLEMLAKGGAKDMNAEEAKEQLAKLRAQLAERGVDPDAPEGGSGGHRGRGRGRARGRGAPFRGRGRGAAFAGASLDLRPKRLVLKGWEASGKSIEDVLDTMRAFYLPTGFAEQVDSVPNDGMIVTFATRQQAETAMRSGPVEIPGLPTLTMTWYTGSALRPALGPATVLVTPKDVSGLNTPREDTDTISGRRDRTGEDYDDTWGPEEDV